MNNLVEGINEKRDNYIYLYCFFYYSFAKAEYLPKGGWSMVGRTPINEYENYQIFITIYNQ